MCFNNKHKQQRAGTVITPRQRDLILQALNCAEANMLGHLERGHDRTQRYRRADGAEHSRMPRRDSGLRPRPHVRRDCKGARREELGNGNAGISASEMPANSSLNSSDLLLTFGIRCSIL